MKMQSKDLVIDFRKIGAKVYVGRPNGIEARAHFKIADYEKSDASLITVYFPDDTKTLTSSFFLGMFGDSIIKAGSREQFLYKFKFFCNPSVKKQIDQSIDEALSANFGK